MNPYDFHYLEDFLSFSSLSPNYANLNMVSSPRFRSPGTRFASAIVPVPENSSVAYHKEIYTVLFDPPFFLMVHSIFCHLWKKSKMEKQFLPLPPLRNSLQDTSIHIQEPSTGSVSEAEDETSNSSTSVLGLATTNGDHKFVLVNLDSAKSTKNRSISEISFSSFEDYGIDAVPAIRFFKLRLCLDEFAKLNSEMLIQSPEKTVVCTATAMTILDYVLAARILRAIAIIGIVIAFGLSSILIRQ
ncbi:hypothetical protein QL285_079149 [Trifolium repens]|nr:hypothetical protein QL285_079149 [Trifolium repens]